MKANFENDNWQKLQFFRHSNRQNMNNSDKKLINAFSTIAGMCDRINLPRTVLERAKR